MDNDSKKLPKKLIGEMLKSIKLIINNDMKKTYTTSKEQNSFEEHCLKTYALENNLKSEETINEIMHKEMLQNELLSFRKEVEYKFKSSQTNKMYRFPRKCNEVNDINVNCPADCIFLLLFDSFSIESRNL